MLKRIFLVLMSYAFSISTMAGDDNSWIFSKYTFSPSYDCKAENLNNAEKLICKEPRLSIKDFRLSQIYSQALEKNGSDSKIKDGQRNWIKNIRNKCDTKECLIAAYEKREIYLGGLAIKDGSILVKHEYSGRIEEIKLWKGNDSDAEVLTKEMTNEEKNYNVYFCDYVWRNHAGSMNAGYGGLCWANINKKIDQYFICYNMASSKYEAAPVSNEYLTVRFLEENCYGG